MWYTAKRQGLCLSRIWRSTVKRAARFVRGIGFAVLSAASTSAVVAAMIATDGPRLDAPTAIRNITIVAAPGEKIEGGTIVIRDGRIASVGKDAAVPVGAREIDGTGMTAYAGFIDGLCRTGLEAVERSVAAERRLEGEWQVESDGPQAATVESNRAGIYASRRVEDLTDIEPGTIEKGGTFEKQRRAGFAAGLLAGPRAILGGTSSVIQFGDRPLRHSVVRSGFAHMASFEPPDRRAITLRGRYPSTTFGVMAQFRQVMSDAAWYRDMGAFVEKNPASRAERPYDVELESLQPVIAGRYAMVWEANHEDEIQRALNLCEEFKLRAIIAGGREAWKAAERLKASGTGVILSLALPAKIKEYKLEAESLRKKADDTSMFGKEWEKRPFNPKSAYEIEKRQRDEVVACAAKLEKAGLTWCFTGLDLKEADEAYENLREMMEAGLPEEAALRALTTTPARMMGVDSELGAIRVGMRGNLTVLSGGLSDKEAKVRYVLVDGRPFEMSEGSGARDKEGDKEGEDGERRRGGRRGRSGVDEGKGEKEGEQVGEAVSDSAASQPVTTSTAAPGPYDHVLLHEPAWPTESDAERDAGVRTGGDVLLKNALVITVSGDDQPNTSVLIRKGKIESIGQDVQAPEGVMSIDLTGYCIMPGMIDPHSHIALDSVNEGSLSVTPEVRCEDVVRHDDPDIYRAIAGGCTTIHCMHGSANTIGGQNVMLKLKYGRPTSELVIHDRVRTVKFALGENVKRPGMAPRGAEPREVRRFPGTRMGVETTMRRAFGEARRYGEALAEFDASVRAGRDARPVRRDLRLEALWEILNGRIWVHCHCYRADEILRLLAVAEDFGFRIAVLQHVLEGYRVMPEILRHGCAASTFADWWAYKVEAYQAIPHNAGMMMRYGISATINSDSADLMRHLNFEAAKCMKYSGLTANEALRLVTLNGATQLGLEERIGSIEVGKDGDIAVFSGHPLDTASVCVLTLIEGEVYFRHREFNVSSPPPPSRPAVESPVVALRADGPAAVGTNGHNATEWKDEQAARAPRTSGTNGESARRAEAGVLAIVGGTVHTVSGPVIERGTVLIREGKIEAVGAELKASDGATVIDATGKHVYPGLINAGTALGLSEIGSVDVTIDTSETGAYQPDLTSLSAFDPFSAMIEVTRAEGITTALVVPRGPTISGQAGLVDLDGWSLGEMAIDAKVGLVVSLPSKPAESLADQERRSRRARRGREMPPEPTDDIVAKRVREVEQFFRDAKLYAAAVREASAKGEKAPIPRDARFDAMMPYALGEKPVLFEANEYKQILEVVLFARQLELRAVILGGREAWKAAELLARERIGVIYDGVFAVPRGSDCWDANYRALGEMARAGVRFCTATSDASLAKLLPLEAGFATGHGLTSEEALRAMTLSAAEILGVADRLGSLEPGKTANVVVGTDLPTQATGRVTQVFIRGRRVSLESEHTRRFERWSGRPEPTMPERKAELKGPPAMGTRNSRR